jgi:hypothetical protein
MSKNNYNQLKKSLIGLGVFVLGLSLALSFWVFSFSQEEFKYNGEKQRNPFMPLVTSDGRLLTLQQAPVVKKLALQGITFDQGGLSFCVINGEVARVGDQIDNYLVVKIEREKVTLSKEGETIEMELRKEEGND